MFEGYGLEEAAEEVFVSEKSFPQRLKPDSLQGSYVRAEARTLQRIEFFRSLLSPGLLWEVRFSKLAHSSQTSSHPHLEQKKGPSGEGPICLGSLVV